MTAATDVDPYDALPPGDQVRRVRTPLDWPELRAVMATGHREATGEDPSYKRLAVGCVMAAVEHAGSLPGGPVIPGAAIWCCNIGNIGCAEWPGDWFLLTAREELAHGPRLITQRLRAHSCPEAGAADYWTFLLQPRFSATLAAFDALDVDAAARALKAQRYYTATAESYARELTSWLRVYQRRWPPP